jgi:octaprenyl-diphosphate synthase
MGIGATREVLTADEVFDLVREDLRSVEIAIGVESAASVPAVTTPISKYLERDGGKRLRAALLLLCSRFAGDGNRRMAIQLGAVVEMIHAATLVHDKMIDGAQTRYAWPSDHIHFANRTCVLGGDWLYVRAFRVALEQRVLDVVLCAAQTMVAAELMELDRIGRIAIAESDCLELADRQTAFLFSICGKLGAVAGGVDPRDGEKLAEFARNLGMAFQLTGDVLNLSRDIEDGKVTLPLVYALEHANAPERDLVEGVLRGRRYAAGPFAAVLSLVDRYDGIRRTRERAREFTDCARQILAGFPDSDCRRALFTLADRVAERDC